MKNLGRCSPWNFTPKYCTYTCHTLRVYSPQKFHSDHCLKHFSEYFVVVSSPKKKPHTVCNKRPNIVDLSYRGRTAKLHFGLSPFGAFWFGAIARKGACTVISRSFARSVDIVAWPVQRRFAFCTSLKVLEVI